MDGKVKRCVTKASNGGHLTKLSLLYKSIKLGEGEMEGRMKIMDHVS